jgi:hypothetical protein
MDPVEGFHNVFSQMNYLFPSFSRKKPPIFLSLSVAVR